MTTQDETLLGYLAVQRGWITQAQLTSAVALHVARGPSSRIGTIFVDEGWITISQLEELLAHQLVLRKGPQSPPPARPVITPAPPATDEGWTPGMDPFAAAMQSAPPQPARAVVTQQPAAAPAPRLPSGAFELNPPLKPLATAAANPPAAQTMTLGTVDDTPLDFSQLGGAGGLDFSDASLPRVDNGLELDLGGESLELDLGGESLDFGLGMPDTPPRVDGGIELDFDMGSSPGLELNTDKPVTQAHAPATSREIELDDAGPSLELETGGPSLDFSMPLSANESQVELATNDSDGVDFDDDAPIFYTGARPPAPQLDALLADAARKRASDIHLHPNSPLQIRVDGRLHQEPQPFDNQTIENLVLSALTSKERQTFDHRGQIDFAYTIANIGRFRCNVYKSNHGVNGVFRFIPSFVPTLEQLGIPAELAKITDFHQGMVLCTGPVGCGKSTTLAALVDVINQTKNEHILTIEDPIEYLHPSKKSLVNQRQVNRHTGSFGRALRGALREDPDIIVIGELRDLETISLAMTAAETGHLVLGTLHTGNAISTINRLIGAFPPEEQGQVRTMLSESLRAVISQRLLPRKDGAGRVAAIEVLRMNRAVANTIRENRTFQLRSTLQTGKNQGMMLLDNSLAELVTRGVITREDALRVAEDPRLIR